MAKIKQKEEVFIPETDDFNAKQSYEEWLCEIKSKEPGKLKMLRSNVKITNEQAILLNDGVTNGSNNQGIIYFKI